MKTWRDIPGWFDYGPLYDSAVSLFGSGAGPDYAVFVEVGCYHGQSLCYLGERVKQTKSFIQTYGVDHCLGSIEHQPCQPYDTILKDNIKECGLEGIVVPLIMDSRNAASLWDDGVLDFVFIDAAHDYESVKSDISYWLPKIKKGGVIAGHDFSESWPGVVQAVKDSFPGVENLAHTQCPWCWWVNIN